MKRKRNLEKNWEDAQKAGKAVGEDLECKWSSQCFR